jgi:hypothetical protein
MEDSINELTRGDKVLALITFGMLLVIPLIPFLVFATKTSK